MPKYQSRVRLSLTQKETQALLVMVGERMAGELTEMFRGDPQGVPAAERAERKLRAARDAAEARDRAKEKEV